MTVKVELAEKIFNDTGETVDFENRWINEETAQFAIDSGKKFVAVTNENFVEGESVLNPGKVFLEGHRDINYTVRPFRALQRQWTPEGGFYHTR